ncbi:MAG TPA: hypothetical protein VFA98_16220 [Thermoanaerobaculia bacterium]|nr:hypothetical protein [Thermoanaerobaculia bacterium]
MKKNVVRSIRSEARSGRRTDAQKLGAYVAGFFGRHRREKWPTIRQAARALRWTQVRVEEVVEGNSDGRLMLSMYDLRDPLGDWFVEHLELIQVIDPAKAKLLRTGGMKG